MKLAFAGHRPESLPFGNSDLSAARIRTKSALLTEIMRFAAEGYDVFLQGGERGGDLIFAEQLLLVKATEYPDIRLITVVPYAGQADGWPDDWRRRYARVLELSTNVITLSQRFTDDCYHVRNQYLVDHSDKLLALYNGMPAGSTADAVRYAHQRNKEIIAIDPSTLKRLVVPPRLQTL